MKNVGISVALVLMVYITIAFVVFGDPFDPIFFMTMISDHLGAPSWQLFVVGTAILAVCANIIFGRVGLPPVWWAPAFIALFMSVSLISVAAYAEKLRSEAVLAFKPDAYFERPFYNSLRHAPEEIQVFLHAAALKNCKPYAWSYSQMSFYELPADAAVNVLPPAWVEQCAIERTQR